MDIWAVGGLPSADGCTIDIGSLEYEEELGSERIGLELGVKLGVRSCIHTFSPAPFSPS